MTGKSVLITGGAGFIGSHLTEHLLKMKQKIRILDNLSAGDLANLSVCLQSRNLELLDVDLLSRHKLEDAVKNCEIIFHLAANPEVKTGSTNPETHYQQNIVATFNLLEALRKAGDIKTLVFASSSTVYGEATKIPTPENYTPLKPISIYGATKLACEALITAYAYTYGFKTVIYRLANIVGSRNKHGVIHDFIQKLRKNPEELEILGDGTQTKSYLHISDCIEAMLMGIEKSKNQVEIYNVGSEDQITTTQIAKIIIKQLGLKNVKLNYTGGVNGGRGWKGDVKNMLLDINKLKTLGWKPKLSSRGAVKRATTELIAAPS
jgi:UDP-glucose 4-epimerase